MATNILDAFLITFGLDITEFKKGSDEVERTSKRTRDQVKKAFGDVEDGGKNAGQAIRTISNEVMGLFLAFQGASSLTGLFQQIMNGAASADRLGQTLGVATGKVVAWRQAMAGVGGSEGSADAALSTMERLVQNFRLTGTTGADADLLGLGVNRGDLEKLSPDQLLLKLSGARDHMDGKEFSARMGRLGLPQDMTNFLMQGQSAATSQIDALSKNTGSQDQAAKAAEALQKETAALKAEISTALVPGMTTLAHNLTGIIAGINHFLHPDQPMIGDDGKPIPGSAKKPGADGDYHIWTAPGWLSQLFDLKVLGDHQQGHAPASASGAQPSSAGMTQPAKAAYAYFTSHGVPAHVAEGAAAGIAAEGGGLGFARNGAFGYGQWRGDRLKRLFARYGDHPNAQQQLEFMLWELLGGDKGGKAVMSAKDSGSALDRYITYFMRPQGKNWEHIRDWQQDLIRGHKHLVSSHLSSAHTAAAAHAARPNVHIGKIDVHTQAKDAHGVARDLHHAIRRRVTQSDGGMQN